MEYPYAETGKRIWQLRKKQGLTRERLAEMADISVQFLADIEKGRKNMTVTTLRKLASSLLVTTDYIVNGENSQGSETEKELIELCKSLSSEQQMYASKLLRIFIEATEK
ncbi:MAG: helix-turn-helix transcriptional regulator [Ruminococcus sp.]|nr:helix-turn-helix transcriptional regulator [Ruminococcus sp.]